MLPSAEAEPERYKGRPLLVILENYILDCIGAISKMVRSSSRRGSSFDEVDLLISTATIAGSNSYGPDLTRMDQIRFREVRSRNRTRLRNVAVASS
jgi:hypothetical protein